MYIFSHVCMQLQEGSRVLSIGHSCVPLTMNLSSSISGLFLDEKSTNSETSGPATVSYKHSVLCSPSSPHNLHPHHTLHAAVNARPELLKVDPLTPK